LPPSAFGKGIGGMILSLAEVLGSNGTILPFEGARTHLWRVVVHTSAKVKPLGRWKKHVPQNGESGPTLLMEEMSKTYFSTWNMGVKQGYHAHRDHRPPKTSQNVLVSTSNRVLLDKYEAWLRIRQKEQHVAPLHDSITHQDRIK
jgi:hypothetical protein